MTEYSIIKQSHIASRPNPVSGPVTFSGGSVKPASTTLTVDEEAYTIKCICGFFDDDGDTVLCEPCQTWQHIICYYEPEDRPKEEDSHGCVDCEPRPLDAKRATECQREQRSRGEKPDIIERKAKSKATKSHKKKIKVPDYNVVQINGWPPGRNSPASHQDRAVSSPKDVVLLAKKNKASHRSNGSLNSPSGPQSSNQPVKRPRSGSHINHSQTKNINSHPSYGYTGGPYSLEFLQLYENDPGDAPMQANLFNDINITTSLSLWSYDIEALSEATHGQQAHDIFQRCDQPLDTLTHPLLRKQVKRDESIEIEGRHPTWTYLTIDSDLPKGSIVGELRGKIGHMQDYVKDPANRWDYLRHPLPFVFFHPKLPIYIDTRSEGTCCRFLRRSCRPNAGMRTLLENGSDYRFCFVANDDLEAGAEITIAWTLDEHIRRYLHDMKQDDAVESESNYVADWVGKVLADYGGCACNSPEECHLARYDHRNGIPSSDFSPHLTNGNSKKGRKRYSPETNTHGSGSRAGSESVKHYDDEDMEGSLTGSNSTKSRSRDPTPTNGKFSGFPGEEISAREKRKIAAVEKTFETLEQDRQPAQKKKKRNSGGSNLNTPTATTSVRLIYRDAGDSADGLGQRQLGHNPISQPNTPGVSKARHADVSNHHKFSGSPASRPPNALSHSASAPSTIKREFRPAASAVSEPTPRKAYVSSSMQTEPDEEDAEWHTLKSIPVAPRKPYISLTRRLLMRCHRDRAKLREDAETAAMARTTLYDNRLPPDISNCYDIRTEEAKDLQSIETATMSNHLDQNTEMQDVTPTPNPIPDELPPDIPVQKPRPPDHNNRSPPEPTEYPGVEIKPPPPPLWPTHGTSQMKVHDNLPNGHHLTDLQLQLPPTPQFSSTAFASPPIAITPVSATSTIHQSQFSNYHTSNSYPPVFANSGLNAVQPSPIKKKLSLGDYTSRRKKMETPATTSESQAGSSPDISHIMLKASTSSIEEEKVQSSEDSMVLREDTDRKQETTSEDS